MNNWHDKLSAIPSADSIGVERCVVVDWSAEDNCAKAHLIYSVAPGWVIVPYGGYETLCGLGETVEDALHDLVTGGQAPSQRRTQIDEWIRRPDTAGYRRNKFLLYTTESEPVGALTPHTRHTGGRYSLIIPGAYPTILETLAAEKTRRLLTALHKSTLRISQNPLSTSEAFTTESTYALGAPIPNGDIINNEYYTRDARRKY